MRTSRLPSRGSTRMYFTGHRIVIDAGMAMSLLNSEHRPVQNLVGIPVLRSWRSSFHGVRRSSGAAHRVPREIWRRSAAPMATSQRSTSFAHSMGGLLCEAVQVTYPRLDDRAQNHINKIVTLGTPHQGISFQFLRDWIKLDAEDEIEHFSPALQRDEAAARPAKSRKETDAAFIYFQDYFPLDRLLTVVGTNYRAYSVGVSSWMNRLFSVTGEGGPAYNRSDGLVKRPDAQFPRRACAHLCSTSAMAAMTQLVTSREAYDIRDAFLLREAPRYG